jgi:23S rRNA pseudouridine955/2504/2580 synthase
MKFQTSTISSDDSDQRLDRWLKRLFPGLPQNLIQKALRKGDIRINGKKADSNYRLIENDEVKYPVFEEHTEIEKEVKASKLNLKEYTLYQDDDIFVLNKPQGIAVQGGTNIEDCIDDALHQLQFDKKDRPRLVHRLDKDTSGVLLLARTLKAAQFYATVFKEKHATKLYWAVTIGSPPQTKGMLKAPLLKHNETTYEKVTIDDEGKAAETRYKILKSTDEFTLMQLEPLTGRTHQLRVHCATFGFPILGDGKYGGKEAQLKIGKSRPTLHLHAKSLTIPTLSGQYLNIVAPLPKHMLETFKILGFSDENDKTTLY